METISLREYVDVRFHAVQEAVLKAEAATEKRFAAVNEMRSMVTDAARTYMPRLEYESAHRSLVDKIEALQKMLWVGLGVILALQFIVSTLLIFWKK